jgi:dihydrolipoamide dehydrogenase
VYDADTGQVLGVHTLGPQAEELIGEAALAMEAGIHVQQWAQVVHPHPSIAETLGEVVRMAHGSSILL